MVARDVDLKPRVLSEKFREVIVQFFSVTIISTIRMQKQGKVGFTVSWS